MSQPPNHDPRQHPYHGGPGGPGYSGQPGPQRPSVPPQPGPGGQWQGPPNADWQGPPNAGQWQGPPSGPGWQQPRKSGTGNIVAIVVGIVLGVVILIGAAAAIVAGIVVANKPQVSAPTPAGPASAAASPGVELPDATDAPPNATPGHGIALQGKQPREGTPNLIMYVDYQCPHCAAASTTYFDSIELLVSEGKITAEVRALHFMDTNKGNQWSMKSALGAANADLLGFFDNYHRALMESQAKGVPFDDEVLSTTLPRDASMPGETLAQFQALYAAPNYEAWVTEEGEAPLAAGLETVPRYVVSGVDLPISSPDAAMPATPDGVFTAVTEAWEKGGKTLDG